MSVYHCPICPLVFPARAEVEWHLREEHRSRAGEDADLRAELAAATGPLDWERLRALRDSRGRPAVTLLLSTAPAATMSPLDIARLRQLAERARRRLSSEPDLHTPTSVVELRLAKAVSAAETLRTERGLAVLVNGHDLAIITLPFGPRDRQVVDDRFATRDLEYALRRYPHYRVLVLGRHPRVLEGRARHLTEQPINPSRTVRAVPDHARVEHDDVEAIMDQRVEVAGRLPLVLIGDHRETHEFRRRSRHAAEVIADVAGPRLKRVPIVDLAAPAVEGWLSERQRQAVAELQSADRDDQVWWGVESTWMALQARTAERIWVEHDYQMPGRTLPGVSGVQPTNDPAEPGAIDDLVDALIAKAARLGVPVDLIDPGALQRLEPVAARVPIAAASACPTASAASLAMG